MRHILTLVGATLDDPRLALAQLGGLGNRVDMGFATLARNRFTFFLKLAQALHVNEPDTG
jgi:hypothetical protein